MTDFATISAIILVLVGFARFDFQKPLLFPISLETKSLAARTSFRASRSRKMGPGKDESNKIEESTRRILVPKIAVWKLIPVNDRSRHATLEIMKRMAKDNSRIKVVSVNELPPTSNRG